MTEHETIIRTYASTTAYTREMNEQAIVLLIMTMILIGISIAFGIKHGVFLRWWQAWLSWDWYTRIAVLVLALGSAAVLTWGIH